MIGNQSERILLCMMLHSAMLAIVKADGIFRLVLMDELRVDHENLDIYGDKWHMSLEQFLDSCKLFDYDNNRAIVALYPQSVNQMMLKDAWENTDKISPTQMAIYAKGFKPIQVGKISKTR